MLVDPLICHFKISEGRVSYEFKYIYCKLPSYSLFYLNNHFVRGAIKKTLAHKLRIGC